MKNKKVPVPFSIFKIFLNNFGWPEILLPVPQCRKINQFKQTKRKIAITCRGTVFRANI